MGASGRRFLLSPGWQRRGACGPTGQHEGTGYRGAHGRRDWGFFDRPFHPRGARSKPGLQILSGPAGGEDRDARTGVDRHRGRPVGEHERLRPGPCPRWPVDETAADDRRRRFRGRGAAERPAREAARFRGAGARRLPRDDQQQAAADRDRTLGSLGGVLRG